MESFDRLVYKLVRFGISTTMVPAPVPVPLQVTWVGGLVSEEGGWTCENEGGGRDAACRVTDWGEDTTEKRHRAWTTAGMDEAEYGNGWWKVARERRWPSSYLRMHAWHSSSPCCPPTDTFNCIPVCAGTSCICVCT